MTHIQIEAGTITANSHDRIVSGLLLPYGELGNTNVGRFTVDPGVVTIPEDVTVLAANLDHEREHPVAAFLTAVETPAGIVGSWRVGKGAEGDAILAASPDDPQARRSLSIELAGGVIRAGKLLSARMFGAAFVRKGAFPSATIMAADAGEVTSEYSSHEKDTEGNEYDSSSTTTTTEEVIDGKRVITRTTVSTTEYTEPDPETEEEEEAPVGAATAPNTIVAKDREEKELSLPEVSALILAARRGFGAEQDEALSTIDRQAGTIMAALSDIKMSGAGALPAAGIFQPGWLGELWQGQTYERKVIPRVQTGTITSIDERGMTWNGTRNLVKPWAGNKAELPTGTASTLLGPASVFQRWGYAADIAREFFDIPGYEWMIDSFLRKVAESYAEVTDNWALEQLLGAATVIQAGTFPTTGTNTYSPAIGKLIQGMLALSAKKAKASYAFVALDVWEEILYTPKDQLPEFINLAFSIESGSAGGFVVDYHDELAAGQVFVGDKRAAIVKELPGASPITLTALDIARGGVDKATIGYTQFSETYGDALVLIDDDGVA